MPCLVVLLWCRRGKNWEETWNSDSLMFFRIVHQSFPSWKFPNAFIYWICVYFLLFFLGEGHREPLGTLGKGEDSELPWAHWWLSSKVCGKSNFPRDSGAGNAVPWFEVDEYGHRVGETMGPRWFSNLWVQGIYNFIWLFRFDVISMN